MATTDSQPQNDEQQDGDHPTNGKRIDIHPVVNDTTNQDRESLLLFKVPASLTGDLEGATEQLAIGINKIFTSKITIDHLEFFAWNVSDGIMFAIGAYAGKHQDRTQRRCRKSKRNRARSRSRLQRCTGSWLATRSRTKTVGCPTHSPQKWDRSPSACSVPSPA